MVEGRISQGVIVGEHSDLGGGSSTMGTLSGGGTVRVSVGRHCLIGANAGTGISLGDRCTIEAGLYVTAGTIIDVIDETGTSLRTSRAGNCRPFRHVVHPQQQERQSRVPDESGCHSAERSTALAQLNQHGCVGTHLRPDPA